MRRRPQPSRRRGLIRAGLVVIALTAVLVLVLFFASTRTANAPTAPTVPAFTPHPLPTIHLTPSPSATTKRGTPGAAAHPTATHAVPKATASTTAPKQSLGSPSGVWQEYAPSPRLRVGVGAVTTWAPYFTGARNAYRGGQLLLRTGSVRLRVGQADPFVRPVVDEQQGSVLFVRVAQTKTYPGAVWSLWKYKISTRRAVRLTTAHAMGLTPLGWRGNDILYTIARPSDTSIYSLDRRGHSHFVAILIPQPTVSAFLSPDGRHVAFAAPTNCAYCTLDVYDLQQGSLWNGPSGAPSEYDMAWTANGANLIFAENGKLAVVSPGNGTSQTFAWPHGLPAIWSHTMLVKLSANSIQLTDAVTGRVYRSH